MIMILYCIFSILGMCLIASQSAILELFRDYLKNNFLIVHKLITCPMCLGFWLGVITGFLYGPFEWWNILFNGSFYSATTWFLYSIVIFLGNGYDPSRVINILTPEYIKVQHNDEANKKTYL